MNSNELTSNIGVPQGSILGPLLFLIYINDLDNAIESGEFSLFADDANHYQSDENMFNLINSINHNISLVEQWFLANKLSINIIKTEAMLFSRKPIYFPLPPVILNNIEIPYNFTVKFLGLLIDFKLNWKTHIASIRSKLSSVCGVMYNVRNKIPTSVAKLIYNTIAHPHITYCNVIWSSAYLSNFCSLRSTHKKLIRLILKKRRREHTSPLYKQLNILKFDDISKMQVLSFVFKSLHNIIHSPINYIYRDMNRYNLRNPPILQIPFTRFKQTSLFVRVKGAVLWNDLPDFIRNSLSVMSFKRKLKKYYLDSY